MEKSMLAKLRLKDEKIQQLILKLKALKPAIEGKTPGQEESGNEDQPEDL